MSVFHHKLRFGLLLLGLVLMTTGCLGLFSSKKPPTNSVPPTVVQGTLSGPSGLTGEIKAVAMSNPDSKTLIVELISGFGSQTAFAASAAISGEASLANVPVAVYALAEYLKAPGGAQVLQHGTTDDDGEFTLTGVPTGVDLIVVAATVPRLSAIVPAAGRTMTADVNSATALVAEAWAEALQDENQSFSATDLAAAVQEARQALNALQMDDDALLDALEDLIPSTFGAGLSTTPPPGFDELVDSLNRSAPGFQVETYSIAGSVRDQNGIPKANITISFSDGHASVQTDNDGLWSKDGIEGDVTLSAQDADGFTVVTPPLTVSGEEHNIEITGYAGVVTEAFPAAGAYDVSGKVTLLNGTALDNVNIEAKFASQNVITDASGEFVMTDLDVLAVLVPEREGYVFNPTERTVGRETHDIHFVATPVTTGEPLYVYLSVWDSSEPIVPAGGTKRFSAYVEDPDFKDGVITWNFDGGTWTNSTVSGSHLNRVVDWVAPDTAGTVTATVHVMIGDRSGTAQRDITVTEPLTAFVEADQYVVYPGEDVLLTATFTGYRANEARANWSADHGTIADEHSRATQWTAPDYSGTFTVSLTGSVGGTRSDPVEIEIEVIADPLCEGVPHCIVIRSLDDLQAMRDNLTAHFILANDINASETADWDQGKGFEPIGSSAQPFQGTFDGRNHTIENLYINRPDQIRVGLFGETGSDAHIYDLNLTDVYVIGRYDVGGLVGRGYGNSPGTTIESVHVQGHVEGTYTSGSTHVGGVVGNMGIGTITDVSMTGKVKGRSYIGGLVGSSGGGRTAVYSVLIRESDNFAQVEGINEVGGIVGTTFEYTTVQSVTNWGDIEGVEYVGGVIGFVSSSTKNDFTHLTNTGAVTGTDGIGGLIGLSKASIDILGVNEGTVVGDRYVGGIVGEMTSSTIVDSSNSGTVTGTGSVGGLVGDMHGFIERSYNTASVEATGGTVGGLVGAAGNVVIDLSYNDGSVTSEGNGVGGIIGTSNIATVRRTFNRGVVIGETSVGGLIGSTRNQSSARILVENAYNMGRVSGNSMSGGIFGTFYRGTLRNSYATGGVLATGDDPDYDSIGAVIGYPPSGSNRTIESVYSDNRAEGSWMDKSPAEMTQRDTFVDWDFVNVWMIFEGEDYPDLIENPR